MPSWWSEFYKHTPHGRAASGYAYSTAYKVSGVAPDGMHKTLLRVGDNGDHIELVKFKVCSTEEPTLLEIYSGVTVSSAGTSQTVTNRNLNHTARPSIVTAFSGATTSGGTLIEAHRMSGMKHGGSVLGEDGQWILRPNTDYVISITNESNSSADLVVNVMWHEGD